MSYINDLFSLEGKVVAGFGAGGVLAGEMVCGLARAGARVAVIDLMKDNADKVVSMINKGWDGAAKRSASGLTPLRLMILTSSLKTIIDQWGTGGYTHQRARHQFRHAVFRHHAGRIRQNHGGQPEKHVSHLSDVRRENG